MGPGHGHTRDTAPILPAPTDSLLPMPNRSDDQGPDDGDAEFEERTSSSRPGPARGRFERLLGGGRAAPADRGKSNVSTRRAIDRLDDRERRICFAAAGGAALFGIIIYFSETSSHKHLAKGQLSPQTTLLFGLIAGVLMVVTTYLGRRAPVGFVALFTFLAFSSYFVLGLPFLALAAWLLYRSLKIQRTAAAELRAARSASGSNSSTSRSSAARSSTASAKSSRAASPRSGRAKGPAAPEANKRYTPKRPPPPAPKPSRRERKAAEAPD